MSVWTSVATSGVIAAAVTFAANWWVLRSRARLRMVRSGFTLDDADRLHRAKNPNTPEEQTRTPWHVVRLTNYGDGTAYDIELTGRNCRPRLWVADTGQAEWEGNAPELKWPMWDRKLAALPAGESIQILLMCVLDERNSAEVRARWSDMPGRSRRRSTRYAVKDDRGIETGWPGTNPDL
jgi:hypothetical protein